MLSQVPEVRDDNFYWNNEALCLLGLLSFYFFFPLPFPCYRVYFRQMFDFIPPRSSSCPHYSPCFGLWQVESHN